MIYLLMFLLSLVFMWSGFTLKKNKIIKRILIITSLLIPCIMAGVRGLTVGTDTSGYVWNLYSNAKNIEHFLGMISFSDWLYYSTDYLYLFITYIIGHNQLPFQLLLFVYEFLIVIPIFISLNLNKKNDKNVLFGMFLFYMTFYNLSLNMVRQSIAIAFTILSFSILKNKNIKHKNLLSLFTLLIGYGFHDTALFSILIMILYLIFDNKKIKEGNKNIAFTLIICFSIIFVIFYNPILTIISSIGLYPKANMYLLKYSSFDFNYLGTFRNVILLISILNSKKMYIECNENYKFILLMAILNILFGFLGTFISYGDRIAYYLYYNILFVSVPILSGQSCKINIRIFLLSIFFIIYWLVVIFINNSNETLPYVLFN